MMRLLSMKHSFMKVLSSILLVYFIAFSQSGIIDYQNNKCKVFTAKYLAYEATWFMVDKEPYPVVYMKIKGKNGHVSKLYVKSL